MDSYARYCWFLAGFVSGGGVALQPYTHVLWTVLLGVGVAFAVMAWLFEREAEHE